MFCMFAMKKKKINFIVFVCSVYHNFRKNYKQYFLVEGGGCHSEYRECDLSRKVYLLQSDDKEYMIG